MRNYPSVGVQVADIYLPNSSIDLHKWSVIACDQFTSEPEYWNKVKEIVGDSPSTLMLVLPEVLLGTEEETKRIASTQQAMKEYLEKGYLQPVEGLIYVERTAFGKTRRGLLMALDLEKYDYNKGSQTLIRATEGTIIDRLPPRIRIRENAPLELPHILVLIDDPENTVFEPVNHSLDQLNKVYDFELMLGSGHLTGYHVNRAETEKSVIQALEKLADPDLFRKKYEVGTDFGVLLFAMGDGNHSLATAKAIWEKNKHIVGMDHPSRFALVEIENVHDKGLEFEPIHRVLFGINEKPEQALKAFYGDQIQFEDCPSRREMVEKVKSQSGTEQKIGMIKEDGISILHLSKPKSNLPVGSLQIFLDQWVKSGKGRKIDYVHGEDAVARLGSQPGNVGFYLPAMAKSDLFKTVVIDGALPRKTFSMGEAKEKRFYLEARKIK